MVWVDGQIGHEDDRPPMTTAPGVARRFEVWRPTSPQPMLRVDRFRPQKIAASPSLEREVDSFPAVNEADISIAQHPKNEPGTLLCDHLAVG